MNNIKIPENVKPPTKVVVRLLPPSLSEDVFLQAIAPEIVKAFVWFRYVAGKRRKSFEKPSTNARAYVSFQSVELALDFCSRYHGHAFVDEKGETYKAVACFAPYQQVPRVSVPSDRKANTMETDPQYLKFIESLPDKNNGDEPPPDRLSGPSPTEVVSGEGPKEPLQSTQPEGTEPTGANNTSEHPVLTPLILALQEKYRLRLQRQSDMADRKRQQMIKAKHLQLLRKRTASATTAGTAVSESMQPQLSISQQQQQRYPVQQHRLSRSKEAVQSRDGRSPPSRSTVSSKSRRVPSTVGHEGSSRGPVAGTGSSALKSGLRRHEKRSGPIHQTKKGAQGAHQAGGFGALGGTGLTHASVPGSTVGAPTSSVIPSSPPKVYPGKIQILARPAANKDASNAMRTTGAYSSNAAKTMVSGPALNVVSAQTKSSVGNVAEGQEISHPGGESIGSTEAQKPPPRRGRGRGIVNLLHSRVVASALLDSTGRGRGGRGLQQRRQGSIAQQKKK